ncbi:glycosyl hydrolase family protein [bacterium]|nr:MAG: glycosyl hydrolase family protein [bacterium]
MFSDDFSGSSLDTGRWGTYDASQQLQRTRFGFSPQLVTEGNINFARIRLDSYNPQFVGQFKGTEIFTRQRFARGNGLEFSARLRGPNLPPGIIFAFFGIYDRFTGTPSDATYLKDEIDYEFLTAEQEQFSPAGQRKRLYLNLWKDWNVRYGYDGNDVDDTNIYTDKTYRLASDPNFDWANWNTYTVQWFPDRTDFYVNGRLERTEREVKPAQDMSIHLNIWTGTPDFNQAYSASLQPNRTAATNRSFYFDVDHVRIRRLGAAMTTQSTPLFETPLPAGTKSYRLR